MATKTPSHPVRQPPTSDLPKKPPKEIIKGPRDNGDPTTNPK